MKTYQDWINQLELSSHPEGGYFKETYRSNEEIQVDSLGSGTKGTRSLSTGIYFLLTDKNFSAFHRIKSDEMWHFYEGESLLIHMIDENGNYFQQVIGRNIGKGEVLQFVVKAGVWFASEVSSQNGYSLVGCTVSFGFDFQDFEMANSKLIDVYPQHREILSRLIR